jgi:hypothetical protein
MSSRLPSSVTHITEPQGGVKKTDRLLRCNCDYGLYCSLHLYCNAISLCATKANLCYTCFVGITVQVCHLSE